MIDVHEIETLLNRIADQVHAWGQNRPSDPYERLGRAVTLFGASRKVAKQIIQIEAEMSCTLLNIYPLNYMSLSAQAQAVIVTWVGLTKDVYLFQNRDYNLYPQVTKEEIPTVLEKYKCVEQLVSRGFQGKINIDVTDFAYKVSDITLLALQAIFNKLNALFVDSMELERSIEKRIQRWSLVERKYNAERWEDDRQRCMKKLNEHIGVNGDNKESLEKYLDLCDEKARNQDSSLLVELNERFLKQDCFLKFLYEHRNKLSTKDLSDHLSYRFCRKRIMQKIELFDLKQPAIGAYANLFTCRAAQELAELLAPTMATYVDFKFGYQYAALAMAMMDLGLVYADKRNGVEVLTFVNKNLLKNDNQIKNQNLLTQWIGKKCQRWFGELTDDDLSRTTFKLAEYLKLKDVYWHCVSIINQVLQKDLKTLGFAPYLYIEHPNTPAIEKYCHQDNSAFINRLQLLKMAFE